MSCSDRPDSSRSNRQQTGRRYENRAAEFLESEGFTIIERNWRAGHKEIDLIARQDDLVLFVEVKASRTEEFGHPAERVDSRKIQNLHEAAQKYLLSHNLRGCDLRFDVITFQNDEMEHFPDAFRVE